MQVSTGVSGNSEHDAFDMVRRTLSAVTWNLADEALFRR